MEPSKKAKRNKAAAGFLTILLVAVVLLVTSQSKKNDGTSGNASQLLNLNQTKKADIADFGLEIEKINVWTPIIPDVDEMNEADYLKKLEGGVALSKTYVKNPQEAGNMFIFGHSRYYKDKPGDYKEVFKDLNQLKEGDKFKIYYKKQTFNYEVIGFGLVEMNDWTITEDPTPKDKKDKTLTIMTCWPPGTTEKRWAVRAKQI